MYGFDEAKNKRTIDKPKKIQVHLYAAGWTVSGGTGQQGIIIPGVYYADVIIVSPDYTFMDAYVASKVGASYKTLSGDNETLVFECDGSNLPETDLIVNVLMMQAETVT